MSATIIGQNDMVWGVREPKPLNGFPPGRVRLRMRNTDFAQAFVKTHTGIRHFFICEEDEYWCPKFEQGSNYREVIP